MRQFSGPFGWSIAALVLANSAFAAQFDNVIIFGDSLSDAGQYGARYTTNPGITAMENVARYFGHTVRPSTLGGSDYAFGGARVSLLPGFSPATAPPIATQVSTYLAAGPVDPNALYSVWGGGNDEFTQVLQYAIGAATIAQAQAAMNQAATDELTQITRLHAAGARYIVVLNLPDTARTPFGLTAPTLPFSSLSGLYNTTLSQGLAGIGFDVIPINSFALFNEILASPAVYGFSNVTARACTTPSSLTCTPATLVAPDAPTTYIFADDVHPTTASHALIAQYVESVIEAPEKIALLGEVPLQIPGSQQRAIESRFWSDAGPRAKDRFNFYTSYDYDPSTLDPTARSPGNDNKAHTLTVGGDRQYSDSLTAGIALGYSWNKSDFGGNSGGFKLDAGMLSAYAAYQAPHFYGGALATVGDLDFYDIQRNIVLGAATRIESGSTKGTQQALSLIGGYMFDGPRFRHGPVASLAYQRIRVDGYAETGSNSTTMTFDRQERQSFVSSLGWQLTGSMAAAGRMLKPFARVAYEQEHKNDDRSVRAGLVTMGGSFSMPVFKPGDTWVRLDLGLFTHLAANLDAYVAYSGVFSQSNAKANAFTIGVKMAL
jgi:outer membrane lipase/esterase